MKRIVIAGGTGFLGSCLVNYYNKTDNRIVILTRHAKEDGGNIHYQEWDGKSQGPWSATLEGADVIINLNGKSVDCRYTEKNKQLIYSTRLDSTAAIGTAIQQCKNPPKLWINSASATIYRHSLDKEMDEHTGEIGTGFSVDVCQQWERVFNSCTTEKTRKVIVRTGIVIGKNGGPLTPLKTLARTGFGGRQGIGNQYFSWLHEKDFVNILEFIMANQSMSGVYNVTAPNPIPNVQFMKALRDVMGIPFGLPIPKWLLEFGALIIRTETELILKSRRVIPRRLLDAGYRFEFDHIETALKYLAA